VPELTSTQTETLLPWGVVRQGWVVRFTPLMHRRVRVLGGPAVRAACGGTLNLCRCPRIVGCGDR